jgi:hypothetical protein
VLRVASSGTTSLFAEVVARVGEARFILRRPPALLAFDQGVIRGGQDALRQMGEIDVVLPDDGPARPEGTSIAPRFLRQSTISALHHQTNTTTTKSVHSGCGKYCPSTRSAMSAHAVRILHAEP